MNPHLRVTIVQAALAWEDSVTNRRQLAAHLDADPFELGSLQ